MRCRVTWAASAVQQNLFSSVTSLAFCFLTSVTDENTLLQVFVWQRTQVTQTVQETPFVTLFLFVLVFASTYLQIQHLHACSPVKKKVSVCLPVCVYRVGGIVFCCFQLNGMCLCVFVWVGAYVCVGLTGGEHCLWACVQKVRLTLSVWRRGGKKASLSPSMCLSLSPTSLSYHKSVATTQYLKTDSRYKPERVRGWGETLGRWSECVLKEGGQKGSMESVKQEESNKRANDKEWNRKNVPWDGWEEGWEKKEREREKSWEKRWEWKSVTLRYRVKEGNRRVKGRREELWKMSTVKGKPEKSTERRKTAEEMG